MTPLLARVFAAALVLAVVPAQTPTAPAAPVPGAPAASTAPSTPEDAAVKFFREQGLEKSQVMEHLSWLCDVYGPRLTGSPNIRKAQAWAVQTFKDWGLKNAHTEAWGPFGRGWRCDHVLVEVLGENPWPVIAYPKAWSPSLPGRIEADVVLATNVDAEQLKSMDLTGKIVLMEDPRAVNEPFDGISKRHDSEGLLNLADQNQAPRADRRAANATAMNDFRAGFQKRMAVMKVLADKKPLAIVDRGSKGDYGTVFVQGASVTPKGDPAAAAPAPGQFTPRQGPQDVDAAVIPQFTIAVEHYNRICRILKKGLPVKLGIELRTSFTDGDLSDYNVVAEVPGTDPQLESQVVMLGGHFDSWHTGTGCTDNGCGSAVAMEAIRLIQEYAKSTGQGPRRTIRIGLWSGEEEGLLGSRAYVEQHFGKRGGDKTPEHAKLAGYFNLDNGTGKIRGVYLQGNEAVAPIFRAWLKPFHDLGAATLTLNDTGGTDHLSFDGIGLPGFQFIQDPISYDSRTHHSNMDVWDHAVADDLKQAATIEATFVWLTAQRDEMLPRKAEKPQAADAGAARRGGR